MVLSSIGEITRASLHLVLLGRAVGAEDLPVADAQSLQYCLADLAAQDRIQFYAKPFPYFRNCMIMPDPGNR